MDEKKIVTTFIETTKTWWQSFKEFISFCRSKEQTINNFISQQVCICQSYNAEKNQVYSLYIDLQFLAIFRCRLWLTLVILFYSERKKNRINFSTKEIFLGLTHVQFIASRVKILLLLLQFKIFLFGICPTS